MAYAAGNKVEAADYNSFYTRLNAIANYWGGSLSYTAISQNSSITASSHNTLKDKMTSVYNSVAVGMSLLGNHTATSTDIISTVSQGQIIQTSTTAVKINQVLTDWESANNNCSSFSLGLCACPSFSGYDSFTPCPAFNPSTYDVHDMVFISDGSGLDYHGSGNNNFTNDSFSYTNT